MGELKNRDTVAVDTPAAAATSLIVALLGGACGRCVRRERGFWLFKRLGAAICEVV
jgi:hypothetical protein